MRTWVQVKDFIKIRQTNQKGKAVLKNVRLEALYCSQRVCIWINLFNSRVQIGDRDFFLS